MIYITWNGITSNFDCEDPIIKNFLKIGLLVRDVYSTQPKFTTPILLIILSHHMISSNLKSLQRDLTRQDFNKFLIRSIECMSKHILSESYGRDVNSRLYEVGWQNEWYRLAVSVVLLGASISANVGYVFGSDGYLDYYINGEICWGIELTWEGNHLAEHANQFYENGKYKDIPLKEWIILDFWHNSKTVNELKQNFWYILYSDDYSSVTINRCGYEDKICYLQKWCSFSIKKFFLDLCEHITFKFCRLGKLHSIFITNKSEKYYFVIEYIEKKETGQLDKSEYNKIGVLAILMSNVTAHLFISWNSFGINKQKLAPLYIMYYCIIRCNR